MITRLLVTLTIAASAWGQTAKDLPANTDKTEKVDKAAAYYHYTLACMYAYFGSSDSNSDKVSENLKAAIKADPHAPSDLPLRPLPLRLYRPAPVRPAAPAPQPR